ncbi:YqjF family protein [Micromonospora rhizosphaerae]|nr:DUF2071 domain-containing protein [Micromonospora rhizosphaerae]
MLHHWRHLTFLHWRCPTELVQSRLPAGLRVETFDGAAWVGLIPFLMDRVRAPILPSLPWLSRFPETNVRTYVHGPDGRTGIWFLSLDAARLPAVTAARATYGLPYFWSDMSVDSGAAEVVYRARRRWPGPVGARCDARVEFGQPLTEEELTPLDHFLTARYRLYSTLAGRLVAADAEHPRWPLRRARLVELRQDMIQAAGLPAPDHDPILHASAGVPVRIGLWRPA